MQPDKPDEPATPAPAPKPAPGAAPSGDLSGKLRWYYARLFPIKPFTRWLRYGCDDTLSKREISFTLHNDIYIRFKSYASGEALLDALKQLAPVKMDIGAVYNYPPCDKAAMTAPLVPASKELVFDIDMTDYAPVLGRAGGGSADTETDRCWPLMANAVRVLDQALRADFGFARLLWVYSGRRGVHCWVADARARKLSNEARSAVAEFLTLRFDASKENAMRRADVTAPLHPSLARAVRLSERTFRDFTLGRAGVLDDEGGVCKTAELIGGARGVGLGVAERVLRDGAAASGGERWAKMQGEIVRAGRAEWGARGGAELIVLAHTYPRLDVNVSKETNHLLKAPFCVHPKTGRVCVPFRAGDAEGFAPGSDAPRLDALLRDLEGATDGGEAGDEMRKLERGVDIFEEFVRDVESETRERERRARLDAVERRAAAEVMAR